VWSWNIAASHADSDSAVAPQHALYAWSADGGKQAVAQGGTIRIAGAVAGASTLVVAVTLGNVTALALDPAGKLLAAGTSTGHLLVWSDFRKPALFDKQVAATEIPCVAFSDDGQWVAAGGESIHVLETQRGEPAGKSQDIGSWVTALAFGAQKELAAGDFAGRLHIFGADGTSTASLIAAEGSVTQVVYDSHRTYLATAGADGLVKVWGQNRSSPVAQLKETSGVLALAFHPSKPILSVGTRDSAVTTWDLDSQRKLRTLPLGNQSASAMAFRGEDTLMIGLQASPPDRDPALHLLVIAGGTEQATAAADAQAVAEAMVKAARGTFARIDRRELVQPGVDGKQLRDTLQLIARDSTVDDALWVYCAGAAPAKTQPSGGIELSSGTVVTAQQLSEWLNDVAAARQTIVFDAPGATAMQSALRKIDTAQDHSRQGQHRPQAQDRKRLYLAFDRDSQPAQNEAIAPSAAMLIEGLSGAADQFPKDGRITAGELRTYLDQQSLLLAGRGFQGKFELDGNDFDLYSQQSRGASLKQPRLEAQPSEAVFQHRHDYALLIASDQYDAWPALTNPVQDANALKKELEARYGFQVELLTNPTQEQIYGVLALYQQKAYQPGDQLMIFFAGHGDFDENAHEGFLVAKDSRLPATDVNRNTLIPHSRLRNYIDNIPANHVMVIMDVCFGGTFDRKIAESGGARGSMYEDQPVDKLFVQHAQYTTRVFLTSGGKQYVPDGEPGHNSPFVHNLLAELRNPARDRGYITFADLQSAVEPTKPSPVWGSWGKNDAGSDFFLISRSGAQPKVAERTRDLPRPESLVNQRTVVCVVGFKNLSGDLSASVLGDEITELVTNGLGAGDKLNVVPSQERDEMKRSLPLENLSSYSNQTLMQIRQNTHADIVIAGSYMAPREAGGPLYVTFAIQDAQNGGTIDTFNLPGTQAGIFDLVRQANANLLSKLGVSDLSQDQLTQASAGMPKSVKAIEYYSDAMRRLHRGEAMAAVDLLTKADAAEPGVAFIQSGLADAWMELGYDKRAIAAATAALGLSAGMPAQEAASIRGQLSELQGKLSDAMDVYNALALFNPDKLQFGLKLAEIETKAGQGSKALAGLAGLEQLPLPAGSDPRIALDEAQAYEALGEYTRMAASSKKAQQSAAANGARLLEAKANLTLCWAERNLGDQEQALEICRQSYDLYQRIGDKLGMARSQSRTGTILADKSDYSAALAKYRDSADLTNAIGARTDHAGVLEDIARVQIALGHSEDAAATVDEMVALAREVEDSELLVDALFFRADQAHNDGDIRKAQEYLDEALKLAENSANENAKARVASFQAGYGLERGTLDQALASARQCVEIRTRNGDRSGTGVCLQRQGDVLLAQGKIGDARTAYAAAANAFRELKQPGDEAAVWVAQAVLERDDGSIADAERLATKASEEFAREKDVDMQALALSALLDAQVSGGVKPGKEKLVLAGRTWDELAKLHPEDPDVRIEAWMAEARYRAGLSAFDEALQVATQARSACKQRGRVDCELESQLLVDEIDVAAGKNDEAIPDLRDLAANAARLGFLRIGDKANKILAMQGKTAESR
jgi:tetratricopeptide (TPR) repeat protein